MATKKSLKKTKKTRKKKKTSKNPTRKDWEWNHQLLTSAYFELIQQHKKRPTIKMLCEKTKLHKSTVESHLVKIKKEELTERYSDMRLLTDRVLLGLANKGMKGDARAGKLFLQVVENWSEDSNVQAKTNKGLILDTLNKMASK